MSTLTSTLDLTQQKPALAAGVSSDYHRYNAQNNSYNPGSSGTKAVIQIPTGQANLFLLGTESFLEFEVEIGVTALLTNGSFLRFDNSVYSCFGTVNVYHGGTLLSSTPHYGQLANMLLDLGTSDRRSASLQIGCDPVSQYDGVKVMTSTGNAPQVAVPLGPRKFCVPLAGIPILGTGSSQAIPLALLGSADLRLEIELLPAALCFTTCDSKGLSYDESSRGTNAVADIAPTIVVKNIVYNAKVVNLDSGVMGALMQSFAGQPVTLASTGWYVDRAYMAASATSFSAKLNLQYSSLKSVFWWTLAQDIANGTPNGDDLPRPNSRFAGGPIQSTWLSIGGKSFPSDRMTSLAGTPFPYIGKACAFHGAVAWSSVLRCFNASTSVDMPCSIHPAMYNTSVVSVDDEMLTHGKFVMAFDCERADGDSTSVYQGINTQNTPLDLHIQYGARTGAADAVVTMVGHFDVSYIISQGMIQPAI